jgi:hypothetical protein
MAKYDGRSPGRLAELGHCRRLYLSRYKGFSFDAMRQFGFLEALELDYTPITDLDGVERLGVSILKLTECRKLERLDALAGCSSVTLLSLALCNAVSDYSPIGAMEGLQSLFIEARALPSLGFLAGLRRLRSVALGVDRLVTGGVEPLFALDELEHLAIRKRLTKRGDVERMRERWPRAEIVVD